MSNPNIEFKVTNNAKLGEILEVIATEIPEYQMGGTTVIDNAKFSSILEKTLEQTNKSVKIFPKIEVKKQKKVSNVDLFPIGSTTKLETAISEAFVNKVKQITGDTRSIVDLTRDIQRALLNNMKKELGLGRKDKGIQILDSTDYNPDNIRTGHELADLKSVIDTQITNPLLLVSDFKNGLAGNAPMFRKPLLPGFQVSSAAPGVPPVPESTLAGTFPNKVDVTLELFDKRVSEFLEMCVFKLSNLKTAGTITEAEFYNILTQIILSVNEFRNNFLAGTSYADPKNYAPLKSAGNKEIQEIFATITKGSDKAVTDMIGLATGINPTIDQIRNFRAAITKKGDTQIEDKDITITSKDWAVPINTKKIAEEAERISNAIPALPLTGPITANSNLLSNDKIERGVTKTMAKLIAETLVAITDPTEQKLDLIKRTLKLIEDMRAGGPENIFDKKLREKLQAEILPTLSTVGRFEDYFNPLSPGFDITRFGSNFHGGTNSYRVFQDILQKLNQYSNHSDQTIKDYFADLNTKLRKQITEPTGPIQTRLNDLQRRKVAGGISKNEEIELSGLIDTQKLVDIIQTNNAAPLGLDAKRDYSNRELTNTLDQFAKELTKVSAEREKELRAEMEKAKRDLRSAQRANATVVADELETKLGNLDTELKEVREAPAAMKDMMRNAKDIVSRLYSAKANIEKARGSAEKTAIRFKRMEALRTKGISKAVDVAQVLAGGAVGSAVSLATLAPSVKGPVPLTLGNLSPAITEMGTSVKFIFPGKAYFGPLLSTMSPLSNVFAGGLVGGLVAKGLDKLTGGDARRYAAENLYNENVAKVEDLKQQVEGEIDKQEVIIEETLEKMTMLARTFRQYSNSSRGFTTEQKYRYLKDSWQLYYGETDQQKLTEIVSTTSEALIQSHSALEGRMAEKNIGANREGRERFNELRQEYREKHSGRVGFFNNIARRGRGTGPSVASVAGTVTAPGWGIFGRLKNLFA